MKAHRLLDSHRRAQHMIAVSAAGCRRAAERARRSLLLVDIDNRLHDLGRRRRAGAVSEQQFVEERERILHPVLNARVLC